MSPITTDLRRAASVGNYENRDDRDRTTLWSVWEEHHLKLCRVVAKRAGRVVADHDIHDAACDALLRLDRTQSAGRHVEDVSAWLVTVAWREFLRRSGRDGRRRQVEKVMFTRTERVDGVPGPEDVAMDRAGRSARRRALDLALRTLSPGQRASFELFADGASYEQIAVARATTLRAVDRSLRRARRQLRRSDLLAREVREWSA